MASNDDLFGPNGWSNSPAGGDHFQNLQPAAPPEGKLDPNKFLPLGQSPEQQEATAPWWRTLLKNMGSGALEEIAPSDASKGPPPNVKMFGREIPHTSWMNQSLPELIPGAKALERKAYEGGQYDPGTTLGRAEKIGGRVATNLLPSVLGAGFGPQMTDPYLENRLITWMGPKAGPVAANIAERGFQSAVGGAIGGHGHPGRGAAVGGTVGAAPGVGNVRHLLSRHPFMALGALDEFIRSGGRPSLGDLAKLAIIYGAENVTGMLSGLPPSILGNLAGQASDFAQPLADAINQTGDAADRFGQQVQQNWQR